MGKRGGFGGKRRTVLQLDDGSRKQPTYGLGYRASSEELAPTRPDGNTKGLSGLLSQYAQDSETEDSDEDVDTSVYDVEAVFVDEKPSTRPWQKFVAATDTLPNPPPPADDDNATTKSSLVTSKSVSVTSVGAEQKDEIDMKLQDFLAEIDSIEVTKDTAAENDEIDGIPLPTESDTPTVATPAENGKKTSTKVSTKTPSQPGNDAESDEDDEWKGVAPTEPVTVWQQCLDEDTQCYYYWNYETNDVTWEIPAEFSQYLLQYQEYEQALARYEREYAEWRKARRRHRSSRKKHKKNSRKPTSHVTPLVSYQLAEDDDEAQTSLPVFGPFLPPRDTDADPPASSKHVSEHSTTIGKTEAEETADGKQEVARKGDAYDDEIQKLKALHEKFQKRTQKTKRSSGKDLDAGEPTGRDKSANVPSVSTSFEVSSKPAESADNVSEVVCSASEVEAVREETLVVADDEGFVRYEMTNRRYEGDEVGLATEEMEMDVEDIDKQLEMALARHTGDVRSRFNQNSATSGPLPPEVSTKRKADTDASLDEPLPFKKMKSEDDESLDLLPKRIHSSDIKAKINELSEISELSSVIADKLEFLEVTRAGLSKLQLLLVQLETRVEDWRAGALSSERFLHKLRESCTTLHQYESNATPPGWSCHWHSSYKRYFYCHDVTGVTRWDYPEGPETEDQPDEQQHRGVADDAVPDTIEYQSVVPSSTNPQPPVEDMCADVQVEVYPGEPMPPGVDPPIPGALSANILALAGCPPPPPPMTPPETTGSEEIVVDDGQVAATEPSDHPDHSPASDEEQPPGSAIPEPDPEVRQNMVEIVAAPVLNRPLSPEMMQPPGVATEVECSEVSSPTADMVAPLSPSHVTSPSTSSTVDDSATHQHRERRRKKDKAPLVAGGLSLKKKNVSSLVEKWRKVQQDVSDEMNKEQHSKKTKTTHD